MKLPVPDYIQSLSPYVPGKPIEETQREYKLKRVIKLASNENPLGPSPKAMQALKKFLKEVHRYPDASAFHLRSALAKHMKVDFSRILTGNGSDEVIDLLMRIYCVAGDRMVTQKYAFQAYRLSAQVHGVTTIEAPVDDQYRMNLEEGLKLIRADERVKLVFIANPNNPTGTYLPEAGIRSFLSEVAKIRGGSVLVVFDYAYWEFVTAKDLPDPVKLALDFPNVITLRTFSKVYGLAGLRIGYGIAPAEVVATFDKVRKPFNLNFPGMVAAAAALTDKPFVRRSLKLNEQGMAYWEKQLKRLGIPYLPSQGNFLLVDTQAGLGRAGVDVYAECLKRGVIFRPVANYGLHHALRISVGTSEENRIAVKALEGEVKKK